MKDQIPSIVVYEPPKEVVTDQKLKLKETPPKQSSNADKQDKKVAHKQADTKVEREKTKVTVPKPFKLSQKKSPKSSQQSSSKKSPEKEEEQCTNKKQRQVREFKESDDLLKNIIKREEIKKNKAEEIISKYNEAFKEK